MISKKGSLVLRDIVFMMMIVSGIFVFAGIFVSDMATNYENTDMEDEWAETGININGSLTFSQTGEDVEEVGDGMSDDNTGIENLISSVVNSLKGIGGALFMVLTAPNTIGGLIYSTLLDAGVAVSIAYLIKILIITILWSVVIFTIVTIFLRGSKA